jgi:hypothetical protein
MGRRLCCVTTANEDEFICCVGAQLHAALWADLFWGGLIFGPEKKYRQGLNAILIGGVLELLSGLDWTMFSLHWSNSLYS